MSSKLHFDNKTEMFHGFIKTYSFTEISKETMFQWLSEHKVAKSAFLAWISMLELEAS